MHKLVEDWIQDRDKETFVSRFDDESLRVDWKSRVGENQGISSFIYEKLDDLELLDLIRKSYIIGKSRLSSMGLGRYKLYLTESGNATDHVSIYVSTDMFDKDYMNASQRMDIFLGLIVHEGAHILYTNDDEWMKVLSKYPKNKIFKRVLNIIEDEYIERSIGKDYPGYVNYLAATKGYMFTLEHDVIVSVKKAHPIQQIMYAFSSFIRYPKIIDEEILNQFGDLLIDIRKLFVGQYPTSTKESADKSEEVYSYLKKYYEDFKDKKTVTIHCNPSMDDKDCTSDDDLNDLLDEDTTVILEGEKYKNEKQDDSSGPEVEEIIDNREEVENPNEEEEDDEDTDKEEKDESEMEDSSNDSGESSDTGDSEKEDSESTEKDGEAGTSAESDESEDSSGSDRGDQEGSPVSEESTADDGGDDEDETGGEPKEPGEKDSTTDSGGDGSSSEEVPSTEDTREKDSTDGSRGEESDYEESDNSGSTTGTERENESGAGDTTDGDSREDEEGGDKESASDTDENGIDAGSSSSSDGERGEEEEEEVDDESAAGNRGDDKESPEDEGQPGAGSDDGDESMDQDFDGEDEDGDEKNHDYDEEEESELDASREKPEDSSMSADDGDSGSTSNTDDFTVTEIEDNTDGTEDPRDFESDQKDIEDELDENNKILEHSTDEDGESEVATSKEVDISDLMEIEGALIKDTSDPSVMYIPMRNGNKDMYSIIRNKMKPFSRTLARQLNFDVFLRNQKLHGLRNGKLDDGKIVEAVMGIETVYTETIEGKAKGGVIAILIDESGSMCSIEQGGQRRSEIARDLGIMFREALIKTPLEFYIYGHTADNLSITTGNKSIHAAGAGTFILVYREGRLEYSPYNITSISHRHVNRDGHAIEATVRRIRTFTQEPIYLFVISDGMPNAHMYRDHEGVSMSRSSVLEVEKKHNTYVMGIGLNVTYTMDQIYGDNYVNFGNMASFAKDVGKLVRSVIKKSYK